MVTRGFLFLVLVWLLLGLSNPASAQGGNGGDIIGRVVNDSGIPVRQACVSAHESTSTSSLALTTTAVDGSFALENLDPGFYRLRVTDCLESTHGLTWSNSVSVSANSQAEVSLTMPYVGQGF